MQRSDTSHTLKDLEKGFPEPQQNPPSRKTTLQFQAESQPEPTTDAHAANLLAMNDPALLQSAISVSASTTDAKNDFLNPNGDVYHRYLEVAKKFDEHFIQLWDKGLDALLVFSGLFSAVLSAFLIEIRKSLTPDPQDTTNDRLAAILSALTNSSSVPSISSNSHFKPSGRLVTVNGLWFTSLILSLTASLGAILAKTWIIEYGQWTTAREGNSKQEDAINRHRRYTASVDWGLTKVIASIPVLIHIGLFLFFAGLVLLLQEDSARVANVVLAWVAITGVIYLGFTLLPLLSDNNPFRTPLSKPLRRAGPVILYHILPSIPVYLSRIVQIALWIVTIPVAMCCIRRPVSKRAGSPPPTPMQRFYFGPSDKNPQRGLLPRHLIFSASQADANVQALTWLLAHGRKDVLPVMTTLAQLGKLEGLVDMPNVHTVAAIALEELHTILQTNLREPSPTADNWLTADAYIQTCSALLEGLPQPNWIRDTKIFKLVDSLLEVAQDDRIVGELGDNSVILFNQIIRSLWERKQILVQWTDAGGVADLFLKPVATALEFLGSDLQARPPWTDPNTSDANSNSLLVKRRRFTLYDTLCTTHLILRIPGEARNPRRTLLRVKDIQALFASLLHLGFDSFWKIPKGQDILVMLLSHAIEWRFWEGCNDEDLLGILTKRVPSVLNPALRGEEQTEPRRTISTLYRVPYLVQFLQAKDRFRANLLAYAGSFYVGYYALPICAMLDTIATSRTSDDIQYLHSVLDFSSETASPLLAEVSRHLDHPKRPPFAEIGLDDVMEWGLLSTHLAQIPELVELVDGSGIVDSIRQYSDSHPAVADLGEIAEQLDSAVGRVRPGTTESPLGSATGVTPGDSHSLNIPSHPFELEMPRGPSPSESHAMRLPPPSLKVDVSNISHKSSRQSFSAPVTNFNVDRSLAPGTSQTPRMKRSFEQLRSRSPSPQPRGLSPSPSITIEYVGSDANGNGVSGGGGLAQPNGRSRGLGVDGIRRRRSRSLDSDSVSIHSGITSSVNTSRHPDTRHVVLLSPGPEGRDDS